MPPANTLHMGTNEKLVVRFMFHNGQLTPMYHTQSVHTRLEIREHRRPLFKQH